MRSTVLRVVALLLAACSAALPAQAITIDRVVSPGGIEAWLVQDHTLPLATNLYDDLYGPDLPGYQGKLSDRVIPAQLAWTAETHDDDVVGATEQVDDGVALALVVLDHQHPLHLPVQQVGEATQSLLQCLR